MTTSERRKFALEGASVVFEEFLPQEQGKKRRPSALSQREEKKKSSFPNFPLTSL
jgi:hypothetical protein